MTRAKAATIGLNTRMKEPLRARLAAAAKKRGVSLNAEVVHRLEGSFRKEERDALIEAKAVGGVYASFGGLDNFTVMRFLANVINAIETRTGKSWGSDAGTFEGVQEACQTILQIFRPQPGKGKGLEMFANGIHD
jgi:hypothetical protein